MCTVDVSKAFQILLDVVPNGNSDSRRRAREREIVQVDVRDAVRFDDSPSLRIGIGFRIVNDEIETYDWCSE